MCSERTILPVTERARKDVGCYIPGPVEMDVRGRLLVTLSFFTGTLDPESSYITYTEF